NEGMLQASGALPKKIYVPGKGRQKPNWIFPYTFSRLVLNRQSFTFIGRWSQKPIRQVHVPRSRPGLKLERNSLSESIGIRAMIAPENGRTTQSERDLAYARGTEDPECAVGTWPGNCRRSNQASQLPRAAELQNHSNPPPHHGRKRAGASHYTRARIYFCALCYARAGDQAVSPESFGPDLCRLVNGHDGWGD